MRNRRSAIATCENGFSGLHRIPKTMYINILLILQIVCFRTLTANEYVENWSIAENAAIGSRVGKIAANLREIDFEPPFTLIPISGDLGDFIVDAQNGEIRTRNHLDRETCDSYSFVVFPSRGSSIHVTIQIADVNDNRPQFARDFVALEVPENGANVIRSLPAAFDSDQGTNAVQNYTILHGNEEGWFAVESNARRTADGGAVFLDLSVRQPLDRELRDSYSLVIEARDGGRPPLTGHLRVNITISDVNDNHPVFNQTRYYGTVAVNASIGTRIVRVAASDLDAGDNGRVEFVINRRQSDRNGYFDIGRNDGVIVLNKPLMFSEHEAATKSVFELVVIGRDCGKEPLESVTFVTVKVTDAGEQRPIINLIFLDNSHTTANGKIKESVTKGHYVARVQINEPHQQQHVKPQQLKQQQQQQQQPHFNISLIGGDSCFALETKDSSVYVIVAADGTANRKLDRESKSVYKLQLVLTLPPLSQSVQQTQQVITKDFEIEILDVNDNAPQFVQSVYYATVSERESESGADLFVVQVQATDADSDRNARLTYRLQTFNSNNGPSSSLSFLIRDRFKIDSKTGVISTNGRLDCEQLPNPLLLVIATDDGDPQLSATATVSVSVADTNDNEPQFEQPIYRFTVREDIPLNSLIGKVFASDLDCGRNAIVNYSLEDGTGDQQQHQYQQQQSNDFSVDTATGEIRVRKLLDYELRTAYEFEVFAIDQSGLKTSCLVQITIQNVNDNVPQLLSETITVTIEQQNQHQRIGKNTIVAKILAHDPDHDGDGNDGESSQLTYRFVNQNGGGGGDNFLNFVRLNQLTGEFVWSGGFATTALYQSDLTFNVSVSDSGGLITSNPAIVRFLAVSAADSRFQPIFEQFVYRFTIGENAELMSTIGSIRANLPQSNEYDRNFQYSLANEMDRSVFEMDENEGSIRLISKLDYETKKLYSLTGQVVNTLMGNVRKTAYCQIIVEVIDVNDNEPKLMSNSIRLNVPENWSLKMALYKIEAKDTDFASDLIRNHFNYKLYHNFDNMFRVDRENGQLFLQKSFDYESGQRQFVLLVEVSDGLLSSNLTISINVQVQRTGGVFQTDLYFNSLVDVNDNAPKFVKNDYYMDVSESLPIRSRIMQLQATDMDSGKNSRIAYKLAKSAASSKFEIDAKTGWLSLQTGLDREQTNRYELEIVARDSGLRRLSATARLHIAVTDVNDNAPKFANDLYTFEIEESPTAVKRFVGRVTAFDADDAASPNSKLKFSILTADSPFEIDSDSGKVYAIEPLDRETKSCYELMVKVEDQSPQLKRSARTLVRINVTDVNDNYPEIIDPQDDLISVREQQPIGTVVVRVRAIDPDFGENATVTYSLVETNGGEDDALVRERFEIDRFSGEIRTKQVLDHEMKSIYRLAVAATDNGQWWRNNKRHDVGGGGIMEAVDPDEDRRKQSVRLLRVEVLDLSDSRPAFTSTSFRFRVREDIPIGSIVGNVIDLKAMDNVENQQLTIDDRLLNDSFLLDRSSGDLIVTKRLDYESMVQYRFEIRTLDLSVAMNPKSLSIAIVIDVEDVNDNRPQWHDVASSGPILALYIPENSAVNTAIHNFTATDRDSGMNGEIRYHLRNTVGDSKEKFDLDELTGVLSLRAMLDYETSDEYRLIVEACDQAENRTERLKTSLVVRLIVIDANDNRPEFVYPKQTRYPLHANGHFAIGTTVLNVLAIDADSSNNGRVSYAIVSGNQERKFAINTETGRVVLTRPLWDMNEEDANAVQSKPFYLLNITATDHGVPAKMSFMLLNLTLNDGSIDDNNENEDEADGLKSKVFIDGSNGGRLLRSFYQLEIGEDTEIDAELMRIEMKKVAGSNGWKFELAKGIANDTFSVDSNSGVLRLRKVLDRELVKFYSIVVFVVNETSGDFETVTVSLSVRNVNDNRPEFARESCRTVRVQENMPFSLIHTLLAYDRDNDEGDHQITYEILDGNIEQKFELNDRTGELFASELDREQQSVWQLKIGARDSVKWQTVCLLRIEVEDVNDNAPIFEQDLYQVTIDENITIGSFVLAVKATDADSGRNGQVVYGLANEGQSRFRIDNRTGSIFTLGTLDREYRELYEFDVLAYDMAGEAVGPRRSSRVPVRVSIRDLDDNRPVFEQLFYRVLCFNDNCAQSSLVRVRAYDRDLMSASDNTDSDSGIRYRLRDSSAIFRVDEVTGDVRALGTLASDSRYHLWIEIENQPDIKCLVEILTTQIDQQPLQFRNENRIEFELKTDDGSERVEESRSLDIFGNVQAYRIDGRRQPLKYRLVLNRFTNRFVVNEQTGELGCRRENDTMGGWSDELVIEARTIGMPELTAYTSVRVRMIDERENRPQFEQNEYRADVYEGKRKGQFVTEVRANLQTESAGAQSVNYQIIDGNHENAFHFEDSSSGRIRTNLVLDCEIRSFYRLTIVASISDDLSDTFIGGVSQRQLTATSTVLVRVLDVNDNAPTLPAHQLVEIDENAPIGTMVTRVRANDVDSLAQLTYKFDVAANDNEIFEYFTLNTFDGVILLRKRLDFETIREFRIKIIASDSIHEVLTSLTIRVRNTNDNLPVFSQAFYTADIPIGGSERGQGQGQNDNNVGAVDQRKLYLIGVNATDADGDSLKYRLDSHDSDCCFEINEKNGQVFLRSGTDLTALRNFYLLTVSAYDSSETRTSVPILIRKQQQRQKDGVAAIQKNRPSETLPKEFKLKISEDTKPGTIVWKMVATATAAHFDRSRIEIQNGNENLTFTISPANELVLMKRLDREIVDSYVLNLKIFSFTTTTTTTSEAANDSLMLMKLCTIAIEVEDANDNRPVFDAIAAVSVQENVAIGSRLLTAHAIDADRTNTVNSQLNYTIVAGNECGSFEIETRTGHLIVRKSLDYDLQMAAAYSLVIECCDNGVAGYRPQCSLAVANITLRDANDNRPEFATETRYVNVAENEPIGTAVAMIRAYDSDAGAYGNLKYVLSDAVQSVGAAATAADRLSSLFRIDSRTGLISTNAIFDYETERRFVFCVQAFDVDGFSASVIVHVRIESRDEFYPQFTLRTYTFFMRSNFYAGSILGYVKATDADAGIDGRLVYSLSTKNPYFRVNGTDGAIMLKNTIENEIAGSSSSLLTLAIDNRPVSIVVTAGSGRQNSLTNVTIVEIHFDDNLTGSDFILGVSDSSAAAAAAAAGTGSTSGFIIGLLLVVAVSATFAFALLVVYRKHWLNFDFLSRTSIGRGSIPDALRRTRSTRTANGPESLKNGVVASSGGVVGGNLGVLSGGGANGSSGGGVGSRVRRGVPISETKLMLNSSSTTVSSIGNNYAVPAPPFDSASNAHNSMVKRSTGSGANSLQTNAQINHRFQIQPPKYDEIQAYGLSLNGSERSERSRSSGRGSAEDADEEIVDEEIRMITTNASGTTGSRTKEYLAKLGIMTTTETDDAADTISSSETIMSGGNCRQMQPLSRPGSQAFNCALHSTDVSGSGQTAEWTPQYQPLAHVFTEIARLKGGAVSCAAPAAVAAANRRRDCDNMSMRSCASSVRSGSQQQHQPATRRGLSKIALYDTIGGGVGGSGDFSSSDDGQSSTIGHHFVKKQSQPLPQSASISAAAAAIANAAAASSASVSYSGIAIAPTFEQSLSPLQSKLSPSGSPVPSVLTKQAAAPLPAVRFGFKRNQPGIGTGAFANHRRTLENEERI